jgi:hypothetical protein
VSDTEAAWEAVREALERLPGWEATPPHWHPEERLWAATAFCKGDIHRFERCAAVQSRGMTEAEALWELAEALRTR